MIVTEEEYERWPSDMWEHIEGKRQTCSNCAHYGCCADLHHCGGHYWKEAEDGE